VDESKDVRLDDSSLLDGDDDRRDVVVRDDHVGTLLGHLRSFDALAMPMSACFRARSVVHSVSRHRDDLAVMLQRADDPHLVLRRNAGKD
jgi:hypothetical protein